MRTRSTRSSQAAVEFVELMERLEFENFKVSIKSTNVPNTIAANRSLSEKIPYPLHLGITEAGTKWSGSLKSAVGLGTLLADGVGDTIRISLSTFHAEEEVKVAWEILKALQLRERGPVLIACPTCGRLQFDMDSVVAEIETRLEAYEDPIEVAVLGCAVNGIGEASHADFGITGAKNEGLIFAHGKPLRKVPQDDLVDTLFEEIDKSIDRGKIDVDQSKAAEGADWLQKIEEENAGELTPERIAAMEQQAAAEEAEANGDAPPQAGSVPEADEAQAGARRRGLADGGPSLHARLGQQHDSRIDSLGRFARRLDNFARHDLVLARRRHLDRAVARPDATTAGAALDAAGRRDLERVAAVDRPHRQHDLGEAPNGWVPNPGFELRPSRATS